MDHPVRLTPGEFYLLLACPHCRREYIVSDPSKGNWFGDGVKSSSSLLVAVATFRGKSLKASF